MDLRHATRERDGHRHRAADLAPVERGEERRSRRQKQQHAVAGPNAGPPKCRGDALTCSFTLTRLHESYPGMVHGGVSAAILDELMGNVLIHHERKACFLTDLRVRYAGALRVGRAYRAQARLIEPPGESVDVIRGNCRDLRL